jgi:hypothetical protein
MVKEKRLTMVFIMETKLRQQKMEGIRRRLGFDCMFVIDCVGRGGGLALLWGKEIHATIQNYNQRHINAFIQEDAGGIQRKLTCFYR